MTARLHAFPRIDVRDGPRRVMNSRPGSWLAEWREICAKAATIKAIPTAYPLDRRTPRTGEPEKDRAEQRRRSQRFVEEEIST